MKDLYAHDPEFAPACHDVTHALGAAAYEYPSQKSGFRPDQTYSLCGFGFYHGFMETLIAKGGDATIARQLCDAIVSDVPNSGNASRAVCYHGIGHGSVLIHEKSTARLTDIIEKGMPLCRSISDDLAMRQNCANGVIDGAAALVTGKTIPLTDDVKADLYALCRTIGSEYEETCYIGFNWLLLHMMDKNFAPSAAYLLRIPKQSYRENSMVSLASLYTQVVDANSPSFFEALTTACHAVSSDLYPSCMQGMVDGLLYFGAEPGKEYERATQFCESGEVDGQFRRNCIIDMLESAQTMYSQDVYTRVCAPFEKTYGVSCTQI
jgi:hypothetical protein